MNSFNIHIDNSVKGSNSSHDDAASLGQECDVHQVMPDSLSQPTTMQLNKNKNKTRIGTWNVRTLAQKGKLDNLLLEMKRLSIFGKSEMRLKEQGMICKNGNQIIWSGVKNFFQKGVGIVLGPQSPQCYEGHLAVSDRLLMVTMKGPEVDVNISQVYAPTEETEREKCIKTMKF